MATDARVTIHMAMSLDGFIARRDGSVDWMETPDEYAQGEVMTQEINDRSLAAIDAYVMGSRTYETALRFLEQGAGWPYDEKPVHVLTTRTLPKARDTVSFHEGDLARILDERLRPHYPRIWIVGGGRVAGECLSRGLAHQISVSILPVVIGDGIRFFENLDRTCPLHLVEIRGWKAGGIVELRYDVGISGAIGPGPSA